MVLRRNGDAYHVTCTVGRHAAYACRLAAIVTLTVTIDGPK